MNGNKKKLVLYVTLIAMLAIYVGGVSADEIILQNGDRLTGRIVKMGSDILTLDTEYSAPIEIKKGKIKSMSTDSAVDVRLKGGETLKGAIRTETDDRLMVESSDGRNPVSVSWDNVSALNPPAPDSPKWKGNVNIGATTQSGNTDRSSASAGAEAVRKTEKERFSLRFLYNYAEEDDEVSARNAYGAGKYDYFFTKKLYGYISVELLHDEFKNLNLRTIIGPGVGYQVWDDPVKSLSVEGGFSYFSEDLEEGEDDQWVTARLASDISYKVKETVNLSDRFIIYPSLEDLGEYQLRNEAALTTDIGANLALKLSNILEHNSDPSDDVEKSDWQWMLGIQYDFDL
ncbi:MAG: DUF481 domain-containing protein [Nitrospirota bacterium]